jgi:hypothetical protein
VVVCSKNSISVSSYYSICFLIQLYVWGRYRLWPRAADIESPFCSVIHRPLYLELAKQQLFLLPNGQLAKMSGGVFRPDATSESLSLLFRQMFPMFMCPPALADEFRAAGVHDVSEVAADRVRQRLRKDPKVLEACNAIFTRSSETQDEARARIKTFVIDTLEFCLSDLSAHAPAGSPKSFSAVHGLRLLPALSGQLLAFPCDAVVALPDEHKLLPAALLRDNTVDPECVSRLSRQLLNPDFLAAMGLKRFSAAVLAANLHLLLPRHWKGSWTVQGYAGDVGQRGLPEPQWLRAFWALIGPDNIHLVNQWPLVPLTTGELVSAASLPRVLLLPLPAPSLPLDSCSGGGGVCEAVSLYDFGAPDQAPAARVSDVSDLATKPQLQKEEEEARVRLIEEEAERARARHFIRTHPVMTGTLVA